MSNSDATCVNESNSRSGLRWVLAIFALSCFVIVVLYTAYQYVTTSKFFNPSNIVRIPDRPFNNLTDGSIQVKISLSNSLFQVGLLVAAALGGLLIAKRGEAGLVLDDKPEIIMSVCAALLLLSSFIYYALYLNEISYVYYIAGGINEEDPSIPDIFDHNINYLFTYQFVYLLSGVGLASLTFFSAHNLKGGLKS